MERAKYSAQGIRLAVAGAIPLDKLITDVRPLSWLQAGFQHMESGGAVMRILLEA